MYLVVRDKTANNLQNLIADRKQMLREKYNSLQIVSQENKYLTDLANDYEKYYNYIKKQKEEQIEAYNAIYKYLENISKSLEHTESEVLGATHEQEQILRKIKLVKSELDDLVNKD
jgi:hypothetical protein